MVDSNYVTFKLGAMNKQSSSEWHTPASRMTQHRSQHVTSHLPRISSVKGPNTLCTGLDKVNNVFTDT